MTAILQKSTNKKFVEKHKKATTNSARHRVVVCGAGLFGVAVYAFLCEHRNLEVLLLEAGPGVGGGSTMKNHGRIHCGATGAFSDPLEVTQRKLVGNRSTCALDGVLESNVPAIYCCPPDLDHNNFNVSCLERGISLSKVFNIRSPINVKSWISGENVGNCYSVPEYSFNPAKLAEAIAGVARRRGGKSYFNTKVKKVRRNGHDLSVVYSQLGDVDSEISAKFVTNCTSKYANSIIFEDKAPLLDIEFYRWPVMSVKSHLFNHELHNIIVVIDKDGTFPSIIPHGNEITFDAKTKPTLVKSPDAYPKFNPKRFDPTKVKKWTYSEQLGLHSNHLKIYLKKAFMTMFLFFMEFMAGVLEKLQQVTFQNHSVIAM